MINAVCHRYYADTTDIQIKLHEDSLTIWSPGGLPHGLTLEDLQDPDHPSRPRNRLLSQALFDMGYIERYGSGISRMTEVCTEAGLESPKFDLIGGGLPVTFHAHEAADPEKTWDGAFNMKDCQTIAGHPGIQRKDLFTLLDESSRTLDRVLKNLQKRGLIERRGSKKTGGYFPVLTGNGSLNPDCPEPDPFLLTPTR